jgi:filamentous hemagglutinin
MVTVYRGTSRGYENQIFDETGHILSDAAQRSYLETGNLSKAYSSSKSTHDEWIDIWGNEADFVQAHGAFGTELPQAFNLDRTFISVTTDPDVAKYFSQGGTVYSGQVPKSQLIQQTLDGAGESEWLLRNGSDLLKPISP